MISLDIPICGWENIFGKLMDDLEVWKFCFAENISFLIGHLGFGWEFPIWLGISVGQSLPSAVLSRGR
jgi:hypothetical protein